MKLLIFTQKVDRNDPVLGFFHKWIQEFAQRVESVMVICLGEGDHDLPLNVRVFSLGKEKGISKIGFVWNFYKLAFGEFGNYDTVFVHMNPIYAVLGGPMWRLAHKKVLMWYTHRAVDLKLRIATLFSSVVFTASNESFKINTPKKNVVGHGIDVSMYMDIQRTKVLGSEPVRIIHVGRFTEIKNCHTLIHAAHILEEKWNKNFEIVFIGDVVNNADGKYLVEAKDLVTRYGMQNQVIFAGNISPLQVRGEYSRADIAVNMAPTGGVDKAVLESMASGIPTFASNRSFEEYFGEYRDTLMFNICDAQDLAGKIMNLMSNYTLSRVGADLREIAERRANISVLVEKMIKKINELK